MLFLRIHVQLWWVGGVKAHLHIRFPHAFFALRCNFYNLPWLRKTKVSYKKSQRNAVNACGNRMRKLGFSQKKLEGEVTKWKAFYSSTIFLITVGPCCLWDRYPGGPSNSQSFYLPMFLSKILTRCFNYSQSNKIFKNSVFVLNFRYLANLFESIYGE